MTGRLVATWGVLALLASSAAAGPKRKVKIDSEPQKATVYFNIKEDGPVCTTPCEIDVAVGTTPIIIELENHKPKFESLVVAKKPVSVKFKLVPAIGQITVKGPTGAKIVVDEEDKGKAPATFDAFAGPHTIVISLDGKTSTEFVTVVSNEESVVEGKMRVKRPPDKEPEKVVATEGPEEGEGEGEGTTTTTTTTVTAPPVPRGPYIMVAAAMDVGFRNFDYDNAQTGNLTPEKEGGQVMLGPVVEIWPGTLAGVRFLRGLNLLVRYGYGVNPQQVREKTSGAAAGATTFWRVFEASLRHRWTIASTATIELGAGYVRDQFQFSGDPSLVPDADYKSVRIGGRASYLAGVLEPYLTLENRLVLSGGTLEKRFDSADANGLRAALGVEAKIGGFRARVEGAYALYTWTFKSNEMGDPYKADGGTDSIKFINAVLGYAY